MLNKITNFNMIVFRRLKEAVFIFFKSRLLKTQASSRIAHQLGSAYNLAFFF